MIDPNLTEHPHYAAQSEPFGPPELAEAPTQIRLPEPDLENITVLTDELPNDPILPWHHFDSPWLETESLPEVPPDQSPLPGENR